MQVSIVNYKEMIKESNSLRSDAEFFRSDYLKIQKVLMHKPFKKLLDYGVKIRHPGEIKRNYVEDGVFFLRAQNVRPLRIDTLSNPVYIAEHDAKRLSDNTVKKGDILITRTGANFGQCAVYLEDIQTIASSHTFIVKSGELNPFFLSVFLNTKYGRQLIDKGMYGCSQPEIAPYFLYRIPLPLLYEIPQIIEDIYLKSQELINLSASLYKQTQDIILSELGLNRWQPEHQLSFVRNHSDARLGERIDAEYFQPKYEKIINAIKNYKGGWDTLENLCSLTGHPSNPPYADIDDIDKIFIITQKHLGAFTLSDEFWKDEGALFTGKEFAKKNKQYILQEDDVLLYSVGAYIGKANIYKKSIYKENIRATIGSFLTLLRTKKERLNPYYLMSFLNTEPGLAISKQHQRGMAQQYLYPYDIKTFPIPIPDEKIQSMIQQKITESFNLHKKSKYLLECAKKTVEIAIEQDEQTAVQWLESENQYNMSKAAEPHLIGGKLYT